MGTIVAMQWLADPASHGAVAMQRDWYIFMLVAAAVGIFVYACIAWCLIAYRERPGRPAAQFAGNPPLEIVYTIVPLLIVIALFVLTYVIEMPLDRVWAHPPNRIDVTAFRWSWRFEYAGTGIVAQGTPLAAPTLYLPAGTMTEFRLRTADVNHSLWVPAFLFKRDAIPGMTNVFDITPDRTGTFTSRCAQFCGLDHALMTFTVKVVPAAAYDRFIASGGKALP
jgi:cytochrome c oxidase subunit 2